MIAYGKLGGKELGYGSDLDVVFVYDDPETEPDKAAEVYGAFVRKLISLADDAHRRRRAVRHRHGAAPERQLGPAGHVDGLVRELPDRARQQHRLDLGAPGADARPLVRRPRARSRRASRRCAAAVLAAPRDLAALLGEVQAMRDEGARARIRSRPGRFDIKHSAGGMIDVEFAVQALVLGRQRRACPSCSTTSATSPCCGAPRPPGCCPQASARAAADAYRDLRRAQHRARLDEQPTQVDPAPLAEQSNAVLALWRAVFG